MQVVPVQVPCPLPAVLWARSSNVDQPRHPVRDIPNDTRAFGQGILVINDQRVALDFLE